MEHYAGIDVSLESSSVCVVDATGRVVREAKTASEPEALVGWFHQLGVELARIGLEAGPLPQWLYAGMRDAACGGTAGDRHVRDALKAMPVKTDRKDARGIAQLLRLGWFGVRTMLYEAANVILTRPVKASLLKSWAMRAGMRKAKVALARKLAVVLHRMLANDTEFLADKAATAAA